MSLIWRTLGAAIVTWYKSDHSSADYYRLNYKYVRPPCLAWTMAASLNCLALLFQVSESVLFDSRLHVSSSYTIIHSKCFLPQDFNINIKIWADAIVYILAATRCTTKTIRFKLILLKSGWVPPLFFYIISWRWSLLTDGSWKYPSSKLAMSTLA